MKQLTSHCRCLSVSFMHSACNHKMMVGSYIVWSNGFSVIVVVVYRLLLELLRKQLTRAWRPL